MFPAFLGIDCHEMKLGKLLPIFSRYKMLSTNYKI